MEQLEKMIHVYHFWWQADYHSPFVVNWRLGLMSGKWFLSTFLHFTPLKIHMKPKTYLIEKANNLPNLIFGYHVNFSRVYCLYDMIPWYSMKCMDLQACGYGRSSSVRHGTSSRFSSLIFILFQVKGWTHKKKHVQTLRENSCPEIKKDAEKKWPQKSCLDVASKVGPGDPRSGGMAVRKRQVADESKAKNGKTASKVMGLRVGGRCWEVKIHGRSRGGNVRKLSLGKMVLQPYNLLISQYQPKDNDENIIIIIIIIIIIFFF